MNILYQCNNKYAPYCGVSITSLFENNKNSDRISVYILSDNIEQDNLDKFQLLASKYNREIFIIETEQIVQKMIELGMPAYRGSYSANLKMFVSEFGLDTLDRLLYIDSDTVVTGDLSEVFELDIKNSPVAMSQDSLVINHKIDIGFNIEEKYYNSGVILFNIEEWKKQHCTERIVEHVINVRAHYPSPDQDLINVVIKDDIYELPPEYNMEPAYYMFSAKNYYRVFRNPSFYKKEVLEKAKGNEKIIHFFRVMGEFPWHKDNMHPFNDLFDKYLSISPWADYEKELSGIAWVFNAEKLLYKYLPESIFIRLFHLSHIWFMKKSNKLSLKNESNKYM